MKNLYKESLKIHKKHKGKIELSLKFPIVNKLDLSLAYSPGVAEISRQIFRDPKSVSTYTIKSNTVAVISDGSAILGLGNLGAKAAIPVMEGKAALFKRFALIDAFPICLDTQNSEKIIEIVKMISPVFGAINLEDIAAPRCFEIEKKLRSELEIPIMHDDQHGTAVVVLAGLINALKLRKVKKENVKVVINGAGSAGLSIAELILEYGFKNLIILDSKGAINKERKDLNNEKRFFANLTNKENCKGDLFESLKGADIFIGVSNGRDAWGLRSISVS